MIIITSKDLVNWKIAGYAIDDLTQINQVGADDFPLQSGVVGRFLMKIQGVMLDF
jgi:hypothetical protein